MFKKILIANRGEIACRVAATARRMGIRTVAVYSTADAQAKHVAACDEAVWIGDSAPQESYLRWERILQAARDTGAQAIHPGYGFLSENEAFARACDQAGIVFVGPPASAIEAMGLKAQSKRLMAEAGVPLVPGYHDADQNPEVLEAAARRIGYPVLIKASAGGGGKGMRIVHKPDEFASALSSCKREALNSFADDAVLIERYVQRPRHIEIQIFADTHGHVVHLFERDCSVQRRHQKVLEESPAPGLSAELREAMGQAALNAAKAVGYVGAGTVEFIVEQGEDGSMTPYFMEMNTRLQVEHPVTEAVTGLDLVAWQLRVADGEPLPLSQAELTQTGHAIEARVCAESPLDNFLPATGRLVHYQKPAHLAFERGAVRIDDGVREGDAITPFYDSMIAKVIVHGRDREEALARMRQALGELHIVGLPTNVAFLRRLVDSRAFASADLDTALIQREADQVLVDKPLPRIQALAAILGSRIVKSRDQLQADPLARADGWSSHGHTVQQLRHVWQGQADVASVSRDRAGAWTLVLDGQAHTVDAQWRDGVMQVLLDGRSFRASVLVEGEHHHVFTDDGEADVVLPRSHAKPAEADAPGQMRSPMPGHLTWMGVQVGDKVDKGQPLLILEAMKMEHTIVAPVAGTVLSVPYGVGDQVDEGVDLVTLEVSP